MSSTFTGLSLRLSIFGQSHSEAIGMTLDGLPAGIAEDTVKLQAFLNRRAPGRNSWSTPRREEDRPEFLSGLKDGKTCGAPITAIIRNTNTRSKDYSQLKVLPRPGHADYTAEVKFNGCQDFAGGGHFSGRLTAPMCIAGGILLQELERRGIKVDARIRAIAGITDLSAFTESVKGKAFPVSDDEKGRLMQQSIEQAREEGDSVGGIVECRITGVKAGIGSPICSSVPAVTPVIATTEPTERSMPPAIRIMVMELARYIFEEIWRNTFIRFSCVRNLGERMDTTTQIATRPIRMPAFRLK